MQYWLMKSEPETWSWEQQVKAGAKGEGWDGVRNYQASNNMKKMKKWFQLVKLLQINSITENL